MHLRLRYDTNRHALKPDRHAEGSNLSKNINRKKGKTDKGKDFAILNAKLIQILRFTSTANIFLATQK